ncbi:hypothetical protein [Hyphococcus sp.]|uniref:hypothetical protein n=1 Tax=Hyphococcus sp. TaxID=2038636 RepID=UPI0035C7018C
MSETDNDTTQAPASPAAGPNTGPNTGIGGIAQSIGTRNLWLIILTMPAVFLVAVAAIIAIFGKPKKEETAAAAPAAIEGTAPATASSAGGAPIALGEGQSAGAIALDGDRLAVRVDGPDGAVVIVYDIVKGEEIARIPVTRD